MNVLECVFCNRAAPLNEDAVIVNGDGWQVEIHDAAAVPGWYVLRTHRHIENFGDLTEREAKNLGVMVRDLSAALVEGIGATHVYLLSMGERVRHTHFLVATRPTTAEPAAGLELLSRLQTLRDPDAAGAVAARLRSHLAARESADRIGVQP